MVDQMLRPYFACNQTLVSEWSISVKPIGRTPPKPVIEVEVHQQLRAFLREQGEPHWSHHLTMARLVARALRLERSALIQTGTGSGGQGRHRLSYLLPILMWPGPVIIVATEAVQQRLLRVEIPRLMQWIEHPKPIQTGDRWLGSGFAGILLTTPEAWLRDRLFNQGRFPSGIPTLLDGADDLETWTRSQLTTEIVPADWEALMLACPHYAEVIRDIRVSLIKAIFQHPANPYECCLIDDLERQLLCQLDGTLRFGSSEIPAERLYQPYPPTPLHGITAPLPPIWQQFFTQISSPNQLVWATIARQQGQFSLACGPIAVASALSPIWPLQPIVLVGGALDLESDATVYRQNLGLGDLTCLKFGLDRQEDLIQLYQPERLPMPNTEQFQPALLKELRLLLTASAGVCGLVVILVGDTPLKAQAGSILAAEFGSRVQVERTCLEENGILVTGWEFWRQHQNVLPAPRLLVIATLPIPSLEHPLVAARVAHYKQLRQDWFRLYLLPAALSQLQRAIAPVRECQGVVALLDSRVIHRSYGHQVMAALSPLAQINYVDADLFINAAANCNWQD
jgi:ATP-dependent DNA helicase DinG